MLEAIRRGLSGCGHLIRALVVTGVIGMVAAIVNACNLICVACARYFVPTMLRSSAFALAPISSTIAPAVVASAMTGAELLNNHDGIDVDDQTISIGLLGSTTALACAANSATYTPMLAAAINGPVSAMWFMANAVVSGLGMSSGMMLSNALRASNRQ